MARRLGVPPVRYQGNWFPHELRPAAEDGVFFAGDSAGHCLPLSGEGIRTAVLLRHRLRARAARRARRRAHARAGARALRRVLRLPRPLLPHWRCRLQRLIPALPPRALTALLAVIGRPRPCRRAFSWYLEQAHPRFAER